MSLTLAKTWGFRLLPVVLFVISYYYYSNFVLQGAGVTAKSAAPGVSPCGSSGSSKKWAGLDFNITRNSTLFLKLEDYFWHERLSPLSLPYGMKGSEFLLLKVLAVTASYEMPESISKLDCRTCIVVGNGYTIKNSSFGSIIDTYDVVIRLNDAPVRGYEADVGSKTTLRLFYPESASHEPALHNNPDTLMVLVPFKQNDLRWLKEILYDEKRVRKGFWKPPPQIWQGKSSHIRILDPYFLKQTASKLLKIPLLPKWSQHEIRARQLTHGAVGFLEKHKSFFPTHGRELLRFSPQKTGLDDPAKNWIIIPLHMLPESEKRADAFKYFKKNPELSHEWTRSIHPTTGILAIYMALSYCDVVHITGFGYPLSKNQKHPIHYYGSDTMTAMKNSYHDLSHEAQALKRLEKSGAIQYLQRHP